MTKQEWDEYNKNLKNAKDEEIITLYNSLYDTELFKKSQPDQVYTSLPGMNWYMQKIYDIISTDKNKKIVIDVGCGWGILGINLLNILNTYVIFNDICQSALDNIKKSIYNIFLQNEYYEVIFGVSENIPQVQNQECTYVIATELLEHIRNPKELITECIRVCKTGGKIFIVTPIGNWCDSPEHIQHFSREKINSLFSELNHTVEEINNNFFIIVNK